MSNKEYLSRKQAAIFLSSIGCPISPKTLEKMAANNNAGNGPSYTVYRWRRVCYARKDLEEWAEREKRIVR